MARTRSTVKIEEVRELMGEEFARRLEAALAPKPVVARPSFDTQQLVLASQLYSQKPHNPEDWKRIWGVMFGYVHSHGRIQGNFGSYIAAQMELAGDPEGAVMPIEEPRKRRAPVTDPEVLAKRNQALVKAREARAERLAQIREQQQQAEANQAEQFAVAAR